MITAKIATNIALPPNDGFGGISASTYDDLASSELAAVDAVGCVGTVSYTHLTLPTNREV